MFGFASGQVRHCQTIVQLIGPTTMAIGTFPSYHQLADSQMDRKRERERERWRWKAAGRMVGLDPMDINPITKERRGEVPFLAFRLSLKPPLKQNLATVPLIFT